LNDQSKIICPFGLLGGTQVTLVAAITLITVPLPTIQAEFGLQQSDLALLNSAYGLSFGGLLLLGGRLADRLGARRTFVTGIAVFGLASVLGGFAPGYPVLLGARFAQGVGAALAAPAAVALVTRLHPPGPARTRALAIWGTLSVTGAVGGSLLSGLIAAAASWRWSFVIPVGAAAAVTAAWRVLPDVRGMPSHVDLRGALLATTGLIAISYGLLDDFAPFPLGGGLVLLAGFVVTQRMTTEPLLPLSLMAHRRRVIALLVVLVAAAASASVVFLLTLYFQQVRGMTPAWTSLAFLPFLLIITTGPVSSGLLRRFGARPVTVAGLLLTAGSMLLLSLITVDTPYFGLLLAGLLVFPVASGLSFSGATVLALQDAPAGRVGLVGGLVNTAMEVGPTIGLAVLVAIAGLRTEALRATESAAAATTGGFALALATVCLVSLLAAAAVSVVTKKEMQHAVQ